MQLPDRDPHRQCGLLLSKEHASENELELVILPGQDPNSIDQGYARTIEFGVPLPNKDFQLRWSSDSGGARRLGERNRK